MPANTRRGRPRCRLGTHSVLKEGYHAWNVEGRLDSDGGCPAAVPCVCTRHPYRHRQGPVGRRAARRDRRGVQPRPHRKGAHGGDRRRRAVPHSRSESRHLLADVQAGRLQRRQTGGHRTRRHRHADDSGRHACRALEETITVTGERRWSTSRQPSARRCSAPRWSRPCRATAPSAPC